MLFVAHLVRKTVLQLLYRRLAHQQSTFNRIKQCKGYAYTLKKTRIAQQIIRSVSFYEKTLTCRRGKENDRAYLLNTRYRERIVIHEHSQCSPVGYGWDSRRY